MVIGVKSGLRSGRACVRALERIGFHVIRQVGSHMVLRRDEPFCQVVVPDHRTLDRGTLRSILRSVVVAPERFREPPHSDSISGSSCAILILVRRW